MALLAKDILEVYGIKLLSNNLNREIFTSLDAEKLDAGLLKIVARVRLQLILPTIFGLTFLFFLKQHGHGHHPEAQQVAFLLWVILTVSYIIINLAISRDVFNQASLYKIAIILVTYLVI